MRARFEIGFRDVDFARVLYFARYYTYVDRTWTEWLHQYGLRLRDLYTTGRVAMPIVTSHCRYRGPLRLEDELEVRLELHELTTRGFQLDFHHVRVDDAFRVAEGYTQHRFVDPEARRPTEPPPALYDVLERMAAESAGHLASTADA
jgi:acyl-CoA thioester hydrolase